MYQIIIVPRTENPNVPSISLSFKGNERAMKVLKALQQNPHENAEFSDDYGYTTMIRREDILHVLYIDCEQAEVQRLEKNLCLARVSNKLLARVQADPEESRLIAMISQSNERPRSSAEMPRGNIITN